MIARFQIDLSSSLHFHRGLIVLTNTRLLHVEHVASGDINFRSWKLADVDDLAIEEMGATFAVHLMQAGTSTYAWRAISGRVREADAFIAHFNEQKRILRSEAGQAQAAAGERKVGS